MTVQTEQMPRNTAGERRVRVWDAFVRVFHWSVALGFFVAYFTEDELLTVHVWSGYVVGALVLLRILWGFVGPKHARFADFVTGPWTALRYLKDLFAARAKRHIGHSPVGGMMVLALLAGLLGVVWSGLELHAIENDAGPLAAISRPADEAVPTRLLSTAIISLARAHEDDHEADRHRAEAGEQEWEDIHELLANLVMTLVVLHVLGVMLASLVHHENLVRSMLTGTKRDE